MIANRLMRIKKVWTHKLAFAKMEKQLLGKHTLKSITHDLDKLLGLILIWFISTDNIRKFHKKIAKHHRRDKYINNIKLITEKVIDYECARLTKLKSQMTAIEYTKYSHKHDAEIREQLLNRCYELKLKY